jgi:hypothetical protein
VFTGEWVPRSVALADPGKTQLFCQYRDTPSNRRTIDDFEEPHTDTSWQHSTIGGTVSHFGLLGDPKENMLYNLDQHSPHTTSGLGVRWHYPGARLDFSIPFGENDLSSFQTLSFRVTQRYDPIGNSNPLNADQDFYLLLHDATGNERMVKASNSGVFLIHLCEKIIQELCQRFVRLGYRSMPSPSSVQGHQRWTSPGSTNYLSCLDARRMDQSNWTILNLLFNKKI